MRRPERHKAAALSVVVLGSGGFLGRHIGDAFAAQGARVHAVTRNSSDRTPHGAATGSRTTPIDLLTTPPQEVAEFLGSVGADVVVNAAGRAWRADEAQMTAGNAELVLRLVTALEQLPGPPIRLVQLGSVHEYGAGAPNTGTGEEHEPTPVTAYGRTKLLGTQTVLRAAQDRTVEGVVLRLANVIGAGVPEGSLFGRVAAHLAAAARAESRGEKAAELRLPPLRAARDVVDARDAADAVVAAATTVGVAGRVINVGRGEAVGTRELIDRMVRLSGLAVPVVEETAAAMSRTDVDWQRLDVSRARQLLGWRPRRSLDASLRDLLAAALPSSSTRLGGVPDVASRRAPLDAPTTAPVDERK
ncbi:NAD(P)-dependent oxidoreductase [Streptomyces sp. E5N91]|uniref:NAD-dependent epimerase/dehydratase family protein n=1 Tax=Streptomyces sp. E5N91 TaxID=1851996 RepID=UPI00187D4DE4|nr:NAD(P)-dependent oxidoreductase [Streptomyces sp. E5N91]